MLILYARPAVHNVGMDERVQLAEANQQAWTRLHMSVEGARRFENDSAEWAVNARPSGGNLVIAKAFGDNPREEIEGILRIFQQAGQPATWEIGPSCTPPNLTKILRSRHLMGPSYLHLHWRDLAKANPDCPFSVQAVSDWQSYAFERHPLVEWFPKSKRADLIVVQDEISRLAGSNLAHIVIRSGELDAACATVFRTGQVAGIYAVVVLAEMRGRGLGSAITCAAIDMARQMGASFATLQCMRRTTPFYERLGFAAVGTMATMYYSKERSINDATGQNRRRS